MDSGEGGSTADVVALWILLSNAKRGFYLLKSNNPRGEDI